MSTPGSVAESMLVQPAIGLRPQPMLSRQAVLATGDWYRVGGVGSFTVMAPWVARMLAWPAGIGET